MDTFITDLVAFVWPWTLIFCLFVALLVVGLRKVIERVWKGARENWWWNEIVLYMLPMVVGAVAASIFIKYPFPALVTAHSTRFVYGIVCGGFSGFVYKMAKSVLKKKAEEAGVKIPDAVIGDSDPPQGPKA